MDSDNEVQSILTIVADAQSMDENNAYGVCKELYLLFETVIISD